MKKENQKMLKKLKDRNTVACVKSKCNHCPKARIEACNAMLKGMANK